MGKQTNKLDALNAVCPYFTMFPLEIPLGIIRRFAGPNSHVLDPFCGRGTTNFAARLLGIRSTGLDVSAVAAAIADAKTLAVRPDDIVSLADELLTRCNNIYPIPEGEFWKWAFGPRTLRDLVALRGALLDDCVSSERRMLRAIILGALHGPLTKTTDSYFSNQAPRTFAPKPAYSVNYWKRKKLRPKEVHTIGLIERRASRYLTELPDPVDSRVYHADSRSLHGIEMSRDVDLIVTSPPYYGMRTYIPDQWLRNWFIGGPPSVDYQQPAGSLDHGSPDSFVAGLKDVWRSCANVSRPGARLVCRFGGISDRKADPKNILKQSFHESSWKITTIRNAGSAQDGRRQALQFGDRPGEHAKGEFDVYARLN